jgi:hypothetical protein
MAQRLGLGYSSHVSTNHLRLAARRCIAHWHLLPDVGGGKAWRLRLSDGSRVGTNGPHPAATRRPVPCLAPLPQDGVHLARPLLRHLGRLDELDPPLPLHVGFSLVAFSELPLGLLHLLDLSFTAAKDGRRLRLGNGSRVGAIGPRPAARRRIAHWHLLGDVGGRGGGMARRLLLVDVRSVGTGCLCAERRRCIGPLPLLPAVGSGMAAARSLSDEWS